jgi:hypothetical protein
MTKLTLSVDERVCASAKRLAAEHGTSVSAMFARFIQAMAQRKGGRTRGGRIARQASGLIRMPKGKSKAAILTDALLEKYGE